MRRGLGTNLKGSYSRVGVVVDADDDLASRWESIRDILRSAGITVPREPNPTGTIVPGSPELTLERFGVWVMPNNQLAGALEEFLAQMPPEGDSVLQWAKDATQTARETHRAAFPPKDQAKAELHTFLAWQENPGRPYGTAITSHYLNPNAPIANEFMDWFKRLFIDP